MNDDKITDFELRKFFIEYKRKVLAQTMNHPEYDISKNNYHLNSEEGKLTLTISRQINRLHNLISDLDKIVIFLRRFTNKEFYLKNDIDELEYTRYHFEVFVHKIHTILEIKKLLVNDFYEIGLDPKDCNWNNLKNKKGLKNSASSKIIDFYYKSFKHLIELRHLNTHQAIFNDVKMEELKSDLTIYSQFEKFNLDVGEDFKKFRPRFLVDYQVKKYRNDRLEYIKDGKDIAEKYVEQFETIILTDFFNKVMSKNAT